MENMNSKVIVNRGKPTPRVPVNVTEDIIKFAEVRNSGHCMISDAVKQSVPWARSISTDLQTIRFTDAAKKVRYVYLTPRSAQVALVSFDQGIPTKPFRFMLRSGQVTRSRAGDYEKAKIQTEKKGRDTTPVTGISGGRTPPKAALASGGQIRGMRRTFGLRDLKM